MFKKIAKWLEKYPLRTFFIGFCIIPFSFGIILILLPKSVKGIFGICVMGVVFVILSISFVKYKRAKKKLQKWTRKDYEKKWTCYINLVDEVIEEKNYERNKLNKDWILVFDQCIYNLPDIAKYSNQRKFNDFDVAASLMYSLTLDNITDENILFAFECVKRIINESKEYLVYRMYDHVDEMEVANKFETVNINIPNESITSDALTLIIKTYLTQNTYREISKFSDFLRILYLSCK